MLPSGAYLDDDRTGSTEPEAGTAPDTEPAAERAAEADTEPDTEPDEPKARPAKKRGRASVPSWDEIMFGGPKRG